MWVKCVSVRCSVCSVCEKGPSILGLADDRSIGFGFWEAVGRARVCVQ
jgi:hypothetical protein